MSFPVLYRDQICDPSDLSFPVHDYGFLYGVGLFETLGVVSGKPMLLDRHLQRLYNGLADLDIRLPISPEQFSRAIYDYLKQFGERDSGRLNLYVTPGDRVSGHPLGTYGDPLWMAVFRPIAGGDSGLFPSQPVQLAVRTTQFPRGPLPQLKTLSYMASILEKRAVPDWDDVILLDLDDQLLETAFATVYLCCGDRIYTPSAPSVLNSVTRGWLLDHQASLGIQLETRPLFRKDLLVADEIFLAQSTQGIVLVDAVEGVSSLQSGAVAQTLSEKVWLGMQEAST